MNANHQAVERDNDNVVETDFDIQVPARTRLDVNSFSAPVEVTNVQGPHRLKTFSGGIQLAADAWNDQDGIDADSFSGDVRLRSRATRAARSRSTASADGSRATSPSRSSRAVGAPSAAT